MPQSRLTLSNIIPYVPGKSIAEVKAFVQVALPVLKMASNETPLGCSVSLDELSESFGSIHQYPSHLSSGLCVALAARWGFSADHFILGNGSDEVIGFLAMTYVNPGDEVLTSTCTFSEYRFATYLMDGVLIEVPLRSDWHHDLDGIAAKISDKTKIIYLANPNNPTGLFITSGALDRFMMRVPSSVLVVLDEAYAEFSQDPDFPDGADLIARYPNVVILRTFSKLYGLAGLRIGYGVARPEIIADLRKVCAPFNVNSLALSAAKLALDKEAFVTESLRVNGEGLAYFYEELAAMGMSYLKSSGNFVCIFTPVPGLKLSEEFLSEGIIIRALASFGMPDAIRVTIGLPAHNLRFFETFKRILQRI